MSERSMIFLAGKESEIWIETSEFYLSISIFQSKFFIYFIDLKGLIFKFIYSEKTLKMCRNLHIYFDVI